MRKSPAFTVVTRARPHDRRRMIDKVVMRGISELLAIEQAWWLLWERCSRRTPFQSPGWLLPWYRAFRPGEPFAFAFWDAGRLVGIAPFYAKHETDGFHLQPFGTAVSDFLDMLVEPGWEDLVAEALAVALAAEPGWTTITFDELPSDATALRLKTLRACTVSEQIASTCPVLTLECRVPVESNLPSHLQRNLRKARRRAARRGEVHFILADEGAAQCTFDRLVDLHTARWRARDQAGVLADERIQRFHADVIKVLYPKAVARLYELRIAGQTAAAYYGFQDHNRAYAYISGFDPRFAHESPGSLLLAHVIADSASTGAQEFHFLRGSETYKYAWGAHDRRNHRRQFVRIASLADVI
jgi:CelD/BcsL family acetyltransferase involved in cellulose biosynthesis